MKTCSGCKRKLDLDEFHKSKTGVLGVQGYCKQCKKDMSSKYEESRRGKRSEYGKEQWQKRKEDPEYHAKRKAWLEENADKLSEKASERYRKNKQSYAAYRANQRAKKYNSPGIILRADWDFVVDAANGLCLCCESEDYLTLDHVKALDAGGSNFIGNIQPLCLRCHMKKGVRVVDFRTREFSQAVEENCKGQYMG